MHNVVLWWHAVERWLLFVAYNVAWCGQHHIPGWQVLRWPFTWAWWSHIPYGGLLAMERAQTRLAFDARGALAVEHLLLGGFVAVLGLAALVSLLRRLERARLRNPQIWEEGHMEPDSVRWATRREVDTYRHSATPLALGRWCDLSGRPKGSPLSLPWPAARRNILTVGPPGAGKSVGFVKWMLGMERVDSATPSLFIWDVKGELGGLCAGHLAAVGYRVVQLHPFLDRGRVNPLVWCESARWCDLFWEAWLANSDSGIGSVVAERTHEDWSRQVLTAMTLALKVRHGPTAVTLPLVFDALKGKDQDIYDTLKTATDGGAGASMWLSLMQKGGTAFSNQRNSLVMRGDLFKDAEPRRFVSGHDMDLSGMLGVAGHTPHAVFFQLPTAMQDIVKPLTAGVVALLFAKVAEIAGGRQLPRPLLCLFDEAGSGATIPRLYDWLNTLRGAGVAQWIVVQYLAQLTQKYGKDGAAGIKAGCGTWVGLAGMLVEDAAEFEARIGEQRTKVRTVERKLVNGTITESEKGRKVEASALLRGDMLRRLPDYTSIVVPNNGWPFLVYNAPYFADAALMKRAGREEEGPYGATQGGHMAVEDARTDAAVAVSAGRPGRDAGPTASREEVTIETSAVVVRRREPVQFRR